VVETNEVAVIRQLLKSDDLRQIELGISQALEFVEAYSSESNNAVWTIINDYDKAKKGARKKVRKKVPEGLNFNQINLML